MTTLRQQDIPTDHIKKILIMGHANIGDVVCNCVAIKPIRDRFPDAEISFLTSPKAREVVEGYPGLDRMIIFAKKGEHKPFWKRWAFQASLKREGFDLVIALKNTLRHKFMGAKYTWGVRDYLGKDFAESRTHLVDIYLGFLKSLGFDCPEPLVDFSTASQDQAFCETTLKQNDIKPNDQFVVILPVAAWYVKNWPVERWNDLAKQLKERGIKTIAIGKSNPLPYTQTILKELSSDIISLVDHTTLKQALALCRKASLFLGPDSSLVHWCSILNIDTVGIYGSTPQDYMYPYRHKDNIVALKEKPADRTCYTDPQACLCNNDDKPGICMEQISVDDVFQKTLERLKLA